MYKSEQVYIKKLCSPEIAAQADIRHFFGYSQDIITKTSSLHSRLIFRRCLIGRLFIGPV